MSTTHQIAAACPPVTPEENRPPSVANVLRLWQVIVLVVLAGALYFDILVNLVRNWAIDGNFSHGYFVPVFAAFVIWRDRQRLAALAAQPSIWGLGIILVALASLIIGSLGSELFLSRVSLLMLIAGAVIYFAGWQLFRAVLFPWVFLFLMVPIPTIIFNQITFPLQLLASEIASFTLPLLGVPVLREGNIIQLPAMPLEVAEACSGIRSLLSLGTLAIMYGYFLENRVWRRVALALASIPIAVAANAVRIVGTGLLVQYWDPDKALGFFHEFSGWVIFVVSLALLFAVQGLLGLIRRSPQEQAHA